MKETILYLTGEKSSIGKYLKNKFLIKPIKIVKYNKARKVNFPNSKKFFLHLNFDLNFYNKNVQKYLESHLSELNDIIKFCKENKIILIFPSTACYFPKIEAHTENDPLFSYNLYYFTKILCEKVIQKNKSLKFLILRIFNIYGTGKNKIIDYIKTNLNKKKIFLNENINLERDFLHVDDFVNLIEKIIRSDEKKFNQIYNVASGKSFKYEILQKFFKKKGKKLIFSNNLKFTPPRPIVKVNIKKAKQRFNWYPKKQLFKYFEN